MTTSASDNPPPTLTVLGFAKALLAGCGTAVTCFSANALTCDPANALAAVDFAALGAGLGAVFFAALGAGFGSAFMAVFDPDLLTTLALGALAVAIFATLWPTFYFDFAVTNFNSPEATC